eukprot:3163767-Pyramimonas_sp.AAC.1
MDILSILGWFCRWICPELVGLPSGSGLSWRAGGSFADGSGCAPLTPHTVRGPMRSFTDGP